MRERVSSILGLTVVVALVAVATGARATSIHADPTVLQIGLGQSADVVVGISLDHPDAVAEAQLFFDPSVVQASAVIDTSLCGSGFPDLCFTAQFNPQPDVLRIGIVDIGGTGPGVPPTPLAGGALEFDFAVVTFTGLALGQTDIVLGPVYGSHDNGGSVLVQIVVSEPVAQLAAPEPGLWLLLAVALLALGLRKGDSPLA